MSWRVFCSTPYKLQRKSPFRHLCWVVGKGLLPETLAEEKAYPASRSFTPCSWQCKASRHQTASSGLGEWRIKGTRKLKTKWTLWLYKGYMIILVFLFCSVDVVGTFILVWRSSSMQLRLLCEMLWIVVVTKQYLNTETEAWSQGKSQHPSYLGIRCEILGEQ